MFPGHQVDVHNFPAVPVSAGVRAGRRVDRDGPRHPDGDAAPAGRQTPAVHQLAPAPGDGGPHLQGQLPPLPQQRAPQVRRGPPRLRLRRLHRLPVGHLHWGTPTQVLLSGIHIFISDLVLHFKKSGWMT